MKQQRPSGTLREWYTCGPRFASGKKINGSSTSMSYVRLRGYGNAYSVMQGEGDADIICTATSPTMAELVGRNLDGRWCCLLKPGRAVDGASRTNTEPKHGRNQQENTCQPW